MIMKTDAYREELRFSKEMGANCVISEIITIIAKCRGWPSQHLHGPFRFLVKI